MRRIKPLDSARWTPPTVSVLTAGVPIQKFSNYVPCPSSISLTSDNNVVVCCSDISAHRVHVISFEAGVLLKFSAGSELGCGIQDAIFHDEKYFVSVDLHMIKVFDSRGEFLYSFGEHGRNPGEFYCPQGLAAGPDNVLFICDSKNKRIQVTTLKGDAITSIAMNGLPFVSQYHVTGTYLSRTVQTRSRCSSQTILPSDSEKWTNARRLRLTLWGSAHAILFLLLYNTILLISAKSRVVESMPASIRLWLV